MNSSIEFLYHATASKIEGDALLPRQNKTLTGISGNYIFAGNDITGAFGYALEHFYFK